MITHKLINALFLLACLNFRVGKSSEEETDKNLEEELEENLDPYEKEGADVGGKHVKIKRCSSRACYQEILEKVGIDHKKKKIPIPIENLVTEQEYPFEKHEIETEDGYLLTYHRIPRGKWQNNEEPTKTGIPVLIQHGLMCSSPSWLISKNFSLPFLLADSGYDVWLGNARGNTYSRAHKDLNPDKDQTFWDFSFDEMGTRDLPAAIDYIVGVTGHPQLYYVGHSMGTTMFYIMASTKPDHAAKVRAMVALAPIVEPWHMASPVARLANRLYGFINRLSKVFHIKELFAHSKGRPWMDRYICSKSKLRWICEDMINLVDGKLRGKLRRPELWQVLEYMPGGASLKTLKHFHQISEQGADFAEFGFKPEFYRFDSPKKHPTTYDLQEISVPMYVYYGMNDWLAVPEDVIRTMKRFKSVKKITKVPEDNFNHLDFMWTMDARELVYEDIVETISKDKDSDSINTDLKSIL